MSTLDWIVLIPWILVLPVLAVGLVFRYATHHPGSRPDRFLTRLWP